MGEHQSRSNNISVDLKMALRNGDHVAYREVYLYFWDSICRFIQALTRNEDVSKEITQEIFLKLWLKRAYIDPDKSLKSFLYTIARNEAIKHFKHQKVEEKYYSVVSNNTDEGLHADTMTLASEVKAIVDIAISQMPKVQRDVITLFSDEGLNTDEIASRLKISKSAVAVHLHNARKELKKIIPLIIFFLI